MRLFIERMNVVAMRHRMNSDESDATLVAAARAGDKAALAMLVARHYQVLLATCRRRVGDRHLAEDAAHEAVLLAMLNLDLLRSPDRFGPWLAGIGRNVCHRALRSRAREPLLDAALNGRRMPTEPLDGEADPALIAEAADQAELVRRAVSTLADGQRSAVELFYLAELSQAEAAALLGIDVGAFKARLHKARSVLRQRLADGEETDMDEKLNRRRLTKTAAALAGLAAVQTHVGAAMAGSQTVGEASVVSQNAADGFVPVRVADLRRQKGDDASAGYHFVVLAEVGGDRRLPIWMGEFEAASIAMHLEQVSAVRPPTYAFAGNLLNAMGGQVREVRIVNLIEEVFYATVIVEGANGTRVVDARPSDALNLSLVTDAPIRVANSVFDGAKDATAVEQPDLSDGAADIVADLLAKNPAWASRAVRLRSDLGGDD